MQPKLCIIAGAGSLPRKIVEHCQSIGRDVVVVAITPYANNSDFTNVPHMACRLGAAGRIINYLRKELVRDVVMVGSVSRPSIWNALPDFYGISFLLRIGRSAFGGDNTLLTAIINEFEAQGFRILGIDQILEGLMAPVGPLGNANLPDNADADVIRGFKEARLLGDQDIGQAVVVQNSKVIAWEDANGTDNLIRRCKVSSSDIKGPILVKAKKPAQDRRVDLPAIGFHTVKLALECGFSGIAVEADNTLIVDRELLIKEADKHNFFVVGVRI